MLDDVCKLFWEHILVFDKLALLIVPLTKNFELNMKKT